MICCHGHSVLGSGAIEHESAICTSLVHCPAGCLAVDYAALVGCTRLTSVVVLRCQPIGGADGPALRAAGGRLRRRRQPRAGGDSGEGGRGETRRDGRVVEQNQISLAVEHSSGDQGDRQREARSTERTSRRRSCLHEEIGSTNLVRE